MLFFIWKTSYPQTFFYGFPCFFALRLRMIPYLFSCMGSRSTCISGLPFYHSLPLCYSHPCLLCSPGTYHPLFLPRAFTLVIFFTWNAFLPTFSMAAPGHPGLSYPLKIKHGISSCSPTPHPQTTMYSLFHHHFTYFVPSYFICHIYDLEFVLKIISSLSSLESTFHRNRDSCLFYIPWYLQNLE